MNMQYLKCERDVNKYVLDLVLHKCRCTLTLDEWFIDKLYGYMQNASWIYNKEDANW